MLHYFFRQNHGHRDGNPNGPHNSQRGPSVAVGIWIQFSVPSTEQKNRNCRRQHGLSLKGVVNTPIPQHQVSYPNFSTNQSAY